MQYFILLTLLATAAAIVEYPDRESVPHSKPWLLTLTRTMRASPGFPLVCSASLISVPYLNDSSDIAITAAHCVGLTMPWSSGVKVGYCHGGKQYYRGFQAIAGNHILEEKEDTEEHRDVVDGECHPSWGKEKNSNDSSDIAVIKLNKPIKFNKHIQPIQLAKKGDRLKPGTKCNIAGWGILSMDHGNIFTAKALNEIDVKIVDDAECLKREKTFEADKSYCEESVKGKGKTCNGDSGGPLVCEKDGKPVQYGVVSFGNHACTKRTNAVIHTDVGAFRDWIDQEIKKLSPK